MIGTAVMLQNCIQKVFGSDLGNNNGSPGSRISAFFFSPFWPLPGHYLE
jgi:hypothetical protein